MNSLKLIFFPALCQMLISYKNEQWFLLRGHIVCLQSHKRHQLVFTGADKSPMIASFEYSIVKVLYKRFYGILMGKSIAESKNAQSHAGSKGYGQ